MNFLWRRMFIKKKIKYNNELYNISVKVYPSKRLCLFLINKHNKIEVTIDLPDTKISDGLILIDPNVANTNLINVLKKIRIIKEIVSVIGYNYVCVPIARINFGKLREYDNFGTNKYFEVRESV